MKFGVAFVEERCDQPIENGTNCFWAKKGVHQRKDGRLVWKPPKCQRRLKQCRLDEFFVENKEVFRRIKEAIDGLTEDCRTDQLRAFSTVIGLAMSDPGVLLDYRTGCKRLADAIIAVDSKNYGNMFSQNEKESNVLTKLLGQTFYYLPPNPEKGVLFSRPT